MQIVFGLTRAGLEPTVYYTRGSKHYATDTVLKNIRARHCKLKKGCIRLAAASHKVYQLPAHGQRFLRVLRLLPPQQLVAMI